MTIHFVFIILMFTKLVTEIPTYYSCECKDSNYCYLPARQTAIEDMKIIKDSSKLSAIYKVLILISSLRRVILWSVIVVFSGHTHMFSYMLTQ